MTNAKPVIHLHAMCLNEQKMIPLFFKHYSDHIARFFIYDNGSTDDSLSLLQGDERVEMRHFQTSPSSFAETARELMNRVWKDSRGRADLVVMAELDEHLQHPDLSGYLAYCNAAGITAIRTVAYEMTSNEFPDGPGPLHARITSGFRAPNMDKLAIFNPDAVVETNFDVGRHHDRLIGRIVYEPFRQVKLLHFKYLGVDYVCGRNATLAKGLRATDLAEGWGRQYLADRAKVEADMSLLRKLSRPVPGLGERAALYLSLDEERLLIEQSGYFDDSFYFKSNPDIPKNDDALLHFCCFGWGENRNPNAFFDMDWYRKTYAELIPKNVNPLLEYIMVGRQENRRSSISFDPVMYRLEKKLVPSADALRHCLESGRIRNWLPNLIFKIRTRRRRAARAR